MTRMKRILEVDAANLTALVEPGVVNLDLSQAVAPHGLYYAPDPSSQRACTIGGNVAENAGGPHCLAYGVTTNHVLGLELVLADGEIVWTGGAARDLPGYDLTGARRRLRGHALHRHEGARAPAAHCRSRRARCSRSSTRSSRRATAVSAIIAPASCRRRWR